MKRHRPYSRREMLGLSAGTLLSLGLWPGALRAADNGRGANFRFLVVNDIHFLNERCAAFLERVLGTMKAGPKFDLCLVAGDLVDDGSEAALTQVKEIFARLGVPFWTVPGNHDFLTQTDRSGYDKVFPGRLNYSFEHNGWLFVGLDSADGLRASNTLIQEPALNWLDSNLAKLDKQAPLVLFTHFPLGDKVTNRPRNADAVLERFKDHNLRMVFGGHYHAFTERHRGDTDLVTDRCCSISRGNHDGSKEKGYFLCEAKDGKVSYKFVEVDTSLAKESAPPAKSPAGQ
jgi:3',5'-cyclic AMP phosphodiesterase CpdA